MRIFSNKQSLDLPNLFHKRSPSLCLIDLPLCLRHCRQLILRMSPHRSPLFHSPLLLCFVFRKYVSSFRPQLACVVFLSPYLICLNQLKIILEQSKAKQMVVLSLGLSSPRLLPRLSQIGDIDEICQINTRTCFLIKVARQQ